MSATKKRKPKRAVAGGRSPNGVYIRGGLPYAERLAAYLAGDHTQFVSPQFSAAVAAIGRKDLDLINLTSTEKDAIAGNDLRWQMGPDGVLMWTESAQSRDTMKVTEALRPDFVWLSTAAHEVYAAMHASEDTAPQWLLDWAQAWAAWGYRYLSMVYDKALKNAQAKGKIGLPQAGTVVSKIMLPLKAFLLEYVPVSAISDRVLKVTGVANHDNWLMPQELLDQRFHGSRLDDFRDEFWNRCCSNCGVVHPSGETSNVLGSTRSHHVQAFLDFIAGELNKQGADSHYGCPFLPRTKSGNLLIRVSEPTSPNGSAGALYETPRPRVSDKSCSWISREYPRFAEWEPFAKAWILDRKTSVDLALKALSCFVGSYLANAGQPGTPSEKLDIECAMRPICGEMGGDAMLLRANRDRIPRTLSEISTNKDMGGVLRAIIDFIDHILQHNCALTEDGHSTLLPDYCNPFESLEIENRGGSTPIETIRTAMPYGWICQLRNILAQGPHFCDWAWAQKALQREHGYSADWFEVDESIIDRSDPDCVWRERTTGAQLNGTKRTFYEMWSPVRWVALLVKLSTALRTLQVRVLDSGESDSWRFDLRQWSAVTYSGTIASQMCTLEGPAARLNTPPGATGTPWVINDLRARNPALYAATMAQQTLRKKGGTRDPAGWSNGVLRAVSGRDREDGLPYMHTVLYINTNKVADAKKEGPAKGFDVPMPVQRCPLPPNEACWVRQGEQQPALPPTFGSERLKKDWLDELGENPHWWLAKLRDWQEKYNPIGARMDWKNLSGTNLMPEKSDEQYSMYRPACFLLREPANRQGSLRSAYPVGDAIVSRAWCFLLGELQTRLNSKLQPGQKPFRLVHERRGTVEFDLHSIRVSIITALIVDGKVRPEFVQRLVGHSRLVMTIYYTKIDGLQMALEIGAGFRRASEKEIENEQRFNENATREQLLEKSAFNDAESALLALGIDQRADERRIVMWERRLGGICPVGGAAANTEGGLSAGCFNGGPLVTSDKKARHAPVEGGPRNCVNCRWFITGLPHLGELQAIVDAANFRKYEWHEKLDKQQEAIDQIKDEWDHMEAVEGGCTATQNAEFNKKLDAAEAMRDCYAESMAIELLIQGNAIRLIQRIADVANQTKADSENALVTNSGPEELKVVLKETTSEMLHAVRVSMHAELHPELNMPSATLRASMVLARKMQKEDIDPFRLLSLPEPLQVRATNALMRHIADLFDPQNLEVGLSKAAALVESNRKLSEITGVSTKRLSDWIDGCSKGDTAIPLQVEERIRLLGVEEGAVK